MTQKYASLAIIALMVALCIPVSAQTEQAWCGTQVFYFDHNESTIPGYETLLNRPSGAPEVVENITITNTMGWVLIDSYVTPDNALEGTISDLAGLRRYRYYTYVSSAVGTTQLNFTPFLRTPDGGEKYFYSAVSDDINDLTVTEYLTSHVSQTPLVFGNSTDRIVIKVYAKTTHSSPISVYWVYQGTTHTSHVETGYFTCPQMISVNLYADAERTPMSPVTPLLAFAISMIAVGLYSSSMRKNQ